MYSVHRTPYWERQRNEPRKEKYKEKKRKRKRESKKKKETNNKRMEDQLLGLGETKEKPKRKPKTKGKIGSLGKNGAFLCKKAKLLGIEPIRDENISNIHVYCSTTQEWSTKSLRPNFSFFSFFYFFYSFLFYVNLSRVRPVHGPWAFICLLLALSHLCSRTPRLVSRYHSVIGSFYYGFICMDGFGDN